MFQIAIETRIRTGSNYLLFFVNIAHTGSTKGVGPGRREDGIKATHHTYRISAGVIAILKFELMSVVTVTGNRDFPN